MKTVRIVNGAVQEIVPDSARPVEKWYGPAFAAQCVEAPDEVEQRWIYDPISGNFLTPPQLSEEPAEPGPEPTDRLAALEAEVNALTEAIEKGLKL